MSEVKPCWNCGKLPWLRHSGEQQYACNCGICGPYKWTEPDAANEWNKMAEAFEKLAELQEKNEWLKAVESYNTAINKVFSERWRRKFGRSLMKRIGTGTTVGWLRGREPATLAENQSPSGGDPGEDSR